MVLVLLTSAVPVLLQGPLYVVLRAQRNFFRAANGTRVRGVWLKLGDDVIWGKRHSTPRLEAGAFLLREAAGLRRATAQGQLVKLRNKGGVIHGCSTIVQTCTNFGIVNGIGIVDLTCATATSNSCSTIVSAVQVVRQNVIFQGVRGYRLCRFSNINCLTGLAASTGHQLM